MALIRVVMNLPDLQNRFSLAGIRLPGKNVALLPFMLLQTLTKRVQPLIEASRIVPEHPVPHIGQ